MNENWIGNKKEYAEKHQMLLTPIVHVIMQQSLAVVRKKGKGNSLYVYFSLQINIRQNFCDVKHLFSVP